MVIIRTLEHFRPLLGRDLLALLYGDWKSQFSLNTIEKDSKLNFVQEFPKVFDEDYTSEIKNAIADILVDRNANPIFHGAYTVPYGLRDKVDQELDRLVECGILKPVKYSRWASPVVVVEKKNGAVRLCMDCRVTINKHVATNSYPLPLVDDILNEFPNCKYFSKIDLAGAFSQIRVDEKSQEYLTINTQKGLMRYTRLPFGVKSAPAIFQRVMDTMIGNMPLVKAYMDDILIGGKSREECLKKTRELLACLEAHDVKANYNKCQFLVTELEFLGFHLSKNGVSTMDKTKAISEAPSPKDLTSLKAYLGLLNF